MLSAEKRLDVTEPGRAGVTLIVALTSMPIDDPTRLDQAAAEVGRVELWFEEEGGEWRLVRAGWSPAGLADLI
ncbi:MAG TPA: hypothetical protein VD788_17580 [Candidatus Polarisedimenticolaceae bacterium]|nr:hypothetical protein [Candidatus Polarisedimenticolaceae bacterium]